MVNNIRILLVLAFVSVLSWDLALRISGDLSFLTGDTYSYLGSVKVPSLLIFSIWVMETTITILGSYAILKLPVSKNIFRSLSKRNGPNPEDLKYECNDCGTRLPRLGESVNIAKSNVSLWSPCCGKEQKRAQVEITSMVPITYKIVGDQVGA